MMVTGESEHKIFKGQKQSVLTSNINLLRGYIKVFTLKSLSFQSFHADERP